MWLKIFILISLFLVGCATEKPKGKTEAEVLFKEAKILMDDGRYIMATEKLNMLKSQYPYSYFATPAELLLADILFKQENYVEAAASYILFRDFHPKYEEIEYVIFKIAESYYKQIPETYDRDLSSAMEAIKYYKELLERHAESKYTTDAVKKIQYCMTMLENKEKYIADFYYKTDVYDAARYRYLKLMREFETPETLDYAMKRIILSSYQLKDWKGCLGYANKFYPVLNKDSQEEINSTIENCKTQTFEE